MRISEHWSAIPEFALQTLKKAGKLASRKNLSLFVVGGFVRDLFLGVKNLDLDLMVEGKGIEFAGDLAETFGGRVKAHEKFGTAIVVLPEGLKIDIAGAREERYARPGALPDVAESSIREDLFRRDFTVNAMALKLNPEEFGKLIDFFGGRRDLEDGVIRVLHNLSFIDDPTRVFRAIRFEQRYHFQMDAQTEQLLVKAIRSGGIGNVTMERVSREILLILGEANPLPAIQRMARLQMLPLIHPKILLSSKMTESMEKIPQVLMEFQTLFQEVGLKPWILYGITLFSELTPENAQEALERLKWPGKEKEKFSLLTRGDWKNVMENLSRTGKAAPSDVTSLLRSVSPEACLFLYAASKSKDARERIRDYVNQHRKVKLLVSGEDLSSLGLRPGPRYKELLEKVKRAQLDGLVHSKEEAKAFLKKEVAKK